MLSSSVFSLLSITRLSSHALMDFHSPQLLSPFRIYMPVESPAVTLYIPSYLPLVWSSSFYLQMQLFIFLCCSRFHSGLFLCFRRLPVYPIFIQVSGSAMISSLPVQQRDLFPSSQQADCFLFGGFFLVWVMWWYFLLFFVLFQFVCLFLNSCIPFCSEMDSQKIENPLNVWLPWIPWCCCQEDDQSLGRDG